MKELAQDLGSIMQAVGHPPQPMLFKLGVIISTAISKFWGREHSPSEAKRGGGCGMRGRGNVKYTPKGRLEIGLQCDPFIPTITCAAPGLKSCKRLIYQDLHLEQYFPK